MKHYRVVFTESARENISESYEWGCREWGEEAAQRWARDLRNSVEKVLKRFPLSQPLAPESEDFPVEIRQMIIGRYRILFIVDGNTVLVLHIRGAFVDRDYQ
jgi:plasmid stabilization system protein ParE